MLKRNVYRDFRERTYDYELTLIKTETEYDDLGNSEVKETKKTILCDVTSVGRSEFYAASNQGMRPNLVFVVHEFEYNGANTVEYDGERYRVVRTYASGDEELELTCERVVGSG